LPNTLEELGPDRTRGRTTSLVRASSKRSPAPLPARAVTLDGLPDERRESVTPHLYREVAR